MSYCYLNIHALKWNPVENRRQFIRMPLVATAYTVVDGRAVPARIVDIGRGGVLLELSGVPLSSLPSLRERSAVAFDLPENPVFSPRSLHCKGVVVRAMAEPDLPPRIAIEFTHVRICPRIALACLPSRHDVSERASTGIHLVSKAKQAHREDAIRDHPRMEQFGA